MLEVVQHQEDLLVAQVVEQLLARRAFTLLKGKSSASAMAGAISSAWRSGASHTKKTPSTKLSCRRAAVSWAWPCTPRRWPGAAPAIKTIFLCPYLTHEEIRREVQEGLNMVETWNSANSFIFYGKRGEVSTNDVDAQEVAILAMHLL
jgi:hypothetical protein